MEKKFELTDEFIVNVWGVKLFRIRATISFGIVKKGDLGGFIESENLPNGNARVYGNAWVYGDAQVSGDAQVYGDARVYGNAWDRSPLQIQGTKHFFNISAKGRIQIGCINNTFAEWLKLFKSIGEEQGYTKPQIAEYKAYIKLAISLSKEK